MGIEHCCLEIFEISTKSRDVEEDMMIEKGLLRADLVRGQLFRTEGRLLKARQDDALLEAAALDALGEGGVGHDRRRPAMVQRHHRRHVLQLHLRGIVDDRGRIRIGIVDGEGQQPEPVVDEIGRATSELQSLMRISYAVFCLKKTKETTSD